MQSLAHEGIAAGFQQRGSDEKQQRDKTLPGLDHRALLRKLADILASPGCNRPETALSCATAFTGWQSIQQRRRIFHGDTVPVRIQPEDHPCRNDRCGQMWPPKAWRIAR